MLRKFSESCPSLTPSAVENLRLARITTAQDYLNAETNTLIVTSRLPYSQVVQVRQELLAKYSAPVINGCDLFERMVSKVAKFKTGLDRLDKVLRGGILTGEITEICGGQGAGKSQLCMFVAAHIAKHHNRSVCYVACKGDLSPARVCEFLGRWGVQENSEEWKNVLEKIQVVKVYEIFKLFSFLSQLHERLNKREDEVKDLRVLIIDSLPCLFSPLIGGESYWIGLSYVGQLASCLKQLASEYHLAVIVVNNTKKDSGASVGQPPMQGDKDISGVYLGSFWAHVPQTRLVIQKETPESKTYKVQVIKSVRGPIGSTCLICL